MEGEAEEYEDAEVIDDAHQIEGDTVDLETGEVTGKAERGEGTVSVWWPMANAPVATDVGEHTQYAELVADYNVDDPAGIDDEDIEHFSVVAIGDGRTRELHAAIAPEDHGLEFAVVYGDAGAGELEAELRTCHNCGTMPSECAMSLDDPDEGMGCGGNGWRPVEESVEGEQAA